MYNAFKERNLLITILAILGLSAITGGLALIISPSGKLLSLHLSFLIHSPFNNFLIPGVILFFVLGLMPLVLIYALLYKPICIVADHYNIFKKMYWAWTFTIYTAIALIIWIQVQMQIGGEVFWIQTTITFVAICIIILTLTPQIRNQYKKTKKVIISSDLSKALE